MLGIASHALLTPTRLGGGGKDGGARGLDAAVGFRHPQQKYAGLRNPLPRTAQKVYESTRASLTRCGEW
jgi:hypothetical protein